MSYNYLDSVTSKLFLPPMLPAAQILGARYYFMTSVVCS